MAAVETVDFYWRIIADNGFLRQQSRENILLDARGLIAVFCRDNLTEEKN